MRLVGVHDQAGRIVGVKVKSSVGKWEGERVIRMTCRNGEVMRGEACTSFKVG